MGNLDRCQLVVTRVKAEFSRNIQEEEEEDGSLEEEALLQN